MIAQLVLHALLFQRHGLHAPVGLMPQLLRQQLVPPLLLAQLAAHVASGALRLIS